MTELKWWQTAVFYQIYPRSFADSTGNGVGDLPGITTHLDYLQDLGVDALWLSPFYPSPQFDCGYDIADYTDVDPEYGSLDDFRLLQDGAHRRGLRIILDLVLNHTSDQHPWFLASRSGRDNAKRDWYVWRDGRDGGPPNNWVSSFGGSAWEYDPTTEQYYYHYFFKEQPDLNWRNPEVKAAMFDAVRFWLDLGVDGFRLDAIDTIFENPELPDHTADHSQMELYQAFDSAGTEAERERLFEQWQLMMQHQVRQPGIHQLFRELRALVDEYDDRVLVGETDDVTYYGQGNDELHLAFNFPLMRTRTLTPSRIRQNQKERLALLPAGSWPCNTLGNHDSSRLKSHFGDGVHDDALARTYLALMLTLRGTPFLYYGEEIGMVDLQLSDVDLLRDNLSVWLYRLMTETFGIPAEEAVTTAAQFGRDKCRTPMQWSAEPNAGFSPAGVTTWLPVNPNHVEGVNVDAQKDDPDSLLSFYRRLIRVRKQNPALVSGNYEPVHQNSEQYLAFQRECETQRCLVVLNLSARPLRLSFDLATKLCRPVFPTGFDQGTLHDLKKLDVKPFGIYIGELAD